MPRGGRIVLVGAGPGAPDLITIRGAKWLARADVVVYDRLVDESLLSLAPRSARLVYAGKAPGRHAMSQEEINSLLVDEAQHGKTVVRLKGGDPLFYGRGEEECAYALARGVPCEVVPGVPSPFGAAAEHLIPLAGRGYSSTVAFAPGRLAGGRPLPREKIHSLLSAADTLVVLMGASRAREILEAAAEARGPGEAAVIVERATLPGSRILAGSIESLLGEAARVSPPAIIVVGGAARWRIDHAGFF